MKPWRRRTSSGVHQGCTRLTRHAVHSHPADADFYTFAGACTTEDDLAQLRFLPYKQEVGGSSPSPPIQPKSLQTGTLCVGLDLHGGLLDRVLGCCRGHVSSPDGVDPEQWRAEIRAQARRDKTRVI